MTDFNYDGFLNIHGLPRLSLARERLLFDDPSHFNINLAKECYEYWRDCAEDVILEHVETKEWRTIPCSKRGNDAWFSRKEARLRPLMNLLHEMHGSFFESHANIKQTPLIEVVLTLPHNTSVPYSYHALPIEFNRWITGLREKYGRISVLRTWESHEDCYGHSHGVLYFHDHKFDVFRYHSRWRVQQKDEIAKNWKGHVDVFALKSWKSAGDYVLKHVTKNLAHEQYDDHAIKMQTLTLAMTWLFRKRTFSLSGSWSSIDLINPLRNSKDFDSVAELLQPRKADLHEGKELPSGLDRPPTKLWRFVGAVRRSMLPSGVNLDCFVATDDLRHLVALQDADRFLSQFGDSLNNGSFWERNANRKGFHQGNRVED